MTNTSPNTRTNTASRRMARAATHTPVAAAKAPGKLDQIEALLMRPEGASIAEMMDATGWQQHSVRGALAGALKKRGLTISSDRSEGTRRYHAEQPA